MPAVKRAVRIERIAFGNQIPIINTQRRQLSLINLLPDRLVRKIKTTFAMASQISSREPAMPLSMIAGESRISTIDQRDSNFPEILLGKQSDWALSAIPCQSSQPVNVNSWQPLQTPSEKVSGRL